MNKPPAETDDQATGYLWALMKVNKAMMAGLETAIFGMDQREELTPERRQSIKEKLAGLMAEDTQIVLSANEEYLRFFDEPDKVIGSTRRPRVMHLADMARLYTTLKNSSLAIVASVLLTEEGTPVFTRWRFKHEQGVLVSKGFAYFDGDISEVAKRRGRQA